MFRQQTIFVERFICVIFAFWRRNFQCENKRSEREGDGGLKTGNFAAAEMRQEHLIVSTTN